MSTHIRTERLEEIAAMSPEDKRKALVGLSRRLKQLNQQISELMYGYVIGEPSTYTFFTHKYCKNSPFLMCYVDEQIALDDDEGDPRCEKCGKLIWD